MQLHPAMSSFAAGMAAKCATELPDAATWSVAYTQDMQAIGRPRLVIHTRIMLHGHGAQSYFYEALARDCSLPGVPERANSARVERHVERLWEQMMERVRLDDGFG